MRPQKITLNAVGASQWIPVDYIESWFGVTIAVIPSEDISGLTCAVQFTIDSWALSPPNLQDRVTISRTTTVATVTDPGPNGIGHGLSTNDSVIVYGSGSANLDSPAPLYGTGTKGFPVASTPSTTTYTYTVANSGATADTGGAYVSRLRVFTHATLTGISARTNGTFNYPVRAVRLSVTAIAAGFVDMIVLQGLAT